MSSGGEPFATAAARRLAELRLEALGGGSRPSSSSAGTSARRRAAGDRRRRAAPRAAATAADARALPLRTAGRGARALPRRTARCSSTSSGSSRARRCRSSSGRSSGRTPRSSSPPRGRVRAAPIVCGGASSSRRSSSRSAPTGGSCVLVSLVDDAPTSPGAPPPLDRGAAAPGARRPHRRFTSADRRADLARLAAEQDAELLVVDVAARRGSLAAAPCDVALAARAGDLRPRGGPVLVPFGGGPR